MKPTPYAYFLPFSLILSVTFSSSQTPPYPHILQKPFLWIKTKLQPFRYKIHEERHFSLSYLSSLVLSTKDLSPTKDIALQRCEAILKSCWRSSYAQPLLSTTYQILSSSDSHFSIQSLHTTVQSIQENPFPSQPPTL